MGTLLMVGPLLIFAPGTFEWVNTALLLILLLFFELNHAASLLHMQVQSRWGGGGQTHEKNHFPLLPK